MRGFYNYPTKGASAADQIIWFEGRVKQLEERNEALKNTIVDLEQHLLDAKWLQKKIVEDFNTIDRPVYERVIAGQKARIEVLEALITALEGMK